MVDPVQVAYAQHGTTHHTKGGCLGECRRCGAHGHLTPVASVVSAKFTGFDSLGHGDGLCHVCAWAYSASTRRLTLAISATAATVLDSVGLFDQLLRPTVSTALVVPLSGRKHVLPHAQWGTVRVDDINLVWRTSDITRLRTVAELRSRGVPPSTLEDPCPSWQWLRTQPEATWSATQQQWRSLTCWRATPYLQLVIKATHHQKGPR